MRGALRAPGVRSPHARLRSPIRRPTRGPRARARLDPRISRPLRQFPVDTRRQGLGLVPAQSAAQGNAVGAERLHCALVEPRGQHRPLRPLVGQVRLGVGAAAVVERDDAPVVGRPLIGADAEDAAQRTGERNEEPASGAGGVGLAHAVGLRAVLALVPAAGGAPHALGGQHAGPPEVEGVHARGVALLIARGLPAGFEALVGLAAGQTVGAGDVAGAQALRPGDPGRGENGVLAGKQLQFTDRGRTAARGPGQSHGPAPAAVAGEVALEQMGHQPLALAAGRDVLADAERLGDLAQGGVGESDGGRGGESPVLGGRGGLGPGGQGTGAGELGRGGIRQGSGRAGRLDRGRHLSCGMSRCVSHPASVGARAVRGHRRPGLGARAGRAATVTSGDGGGPS